MYLHITIQKEYSANGISITSGLFSPRINVFIYISLTFLKEGLAICGGGERKIVATVFWRFDCFVCMEKGRGKHIVTIEFGSLTVVKVLSA